MPRIKLALCICFFGASDLHRLVDLDSILGDEGPRPFTRCWYLFHFFLSYLIIYWVGLCTPQHIHLWWVSSRTRTYDELSKVLAMASYRLFTVAMESLFRRLIRDLLFIYEMNRLVLNYSEHGLGGSPIVNTLTSVAQHDWWATETLFGLNRLLVFKWQSRNDRLNSQIIPSYRVQRAFVENTKKKTMLGNTYIVGNVFVYNLMVLFLQFISIDKRILKS